VLAAGWTDSLGGDGGKLPGTLLVIRGGVTPY